MRATARASHSLEGAADETFILESFKGKNAAICCRHRPSGVEQVAIRLGVHELIAAYCHGIDDDRLEKWPHLCR